MRTALAPMSPFMLAPRSLALDYRVASRSFASACTSRTSDSRLTHVAETGKAQMVSVAEKSATSRIAIARGYVQTTRHALDLIQANTIKKGDVLAVARIAGIMASKQTSNLIPLCHNIALSKVSVDVSLDLQDCKVMIEATAECVGPTGVEMEALTACSTAALTVYDMLKAVDKHMIISGIRVVRKSGGKSGDWSLYDT